MQRVRPHRRLVLAAPLALAACGRREPARTALIEANDHLVVEADFLGHRALALLDNGAPLTSLDQAFAGRAGLKRSAVGAGLDPFDMKIGGAPVAIHPFVEDMAEAVIATDAPVEAFVGMELFRAYVVELSFTRREVVLHPRGAYRPPAGGVLHRVDGDRPPSPGLDIMINGSGPIRAFVDLGCSAALLVSPALADGLRLADAGPVSTRQVILSAADGLTLGVSRLTSISRLDVGGQSFVDAPIDILPASARPFAGLDAIVGAPLLRRFDLAFDLPGRLWLRPNANSPLPFERRMTGLQTRPEGAALLVRHVAQASPAEAAGFREGDMITAIDGGPPLMRTLRYARAGQSLEIALRSGPVRRLVAARYY